MNRGGMVEDDVRVPANLGQTDAVVGVLEGQLPDVCACLHVRAPDLYLRGDVHRDERTRGTRPVLHSHSAAPAQLSHELTGSGQTVADREVPGGGDLQVPEAKIKQAAQKPTKQK